MKSNKPMAIALVVLFLACPASASETRNYSLDKEQIWQLEYEYLSHFKNAAHKKVIPMWHSRFLGWPRLEKSPNDKKAVIEYLKKVAPSPANWEFSIEKKGIQVVNDVAITHLIHHIMYPMSDGSKYKLSTRVTHTWVKGSGNWKILGGMNSSIGKK